MCRAVDLDENLLADDWSWTYLSSDTRPMYVCFLPRLSVT